MINKAAFISSLLILLILFAGVAFSDQNHLLVSKDIKVYIDKSQILEGESPKKLLLKKAEKEGTESIMRLWSMKRYLFVKKAEKLYPLGFSSFFVVKKDFIPYLNPDNYIYEQLFNVKMEFLPCDQVIGDIISIEGERSLAADNYYITIKLKDLSPDSNGAYFVIGRPRTYGPNSKRYYEIIGGGKIYRIVKNLAQGIILVSNREVTMDDKIFLVKAQITPVVKKEKGKKVEEVVVEPKIIKNIKAPTPKETK